MKKFKIIMICITACLMLGLVMIPGKAHAEEIIATVSGTIMSGTTSELLKIKTKDGDMEIKLDSTTDTSAYKFLLPDRKIDISVSHGSDGYLHAVKISSDAAQFLSVTIDTANTATVSGTISDKTKEDVIYLNTGQGEMQIKLDTTTIMSGCAVLVMGKTYYITCARGSDAYMHALSISDTATVNTATGTGTATGAATGIAPGNAATMSIAGTVSSRTTESVLYLSTTGGEMQFIIDSNADTSRGMIHTSGRSLTVTYYHGSDGYLHAVGIVGIKDSAASVEIDSSATASVSGTVGGSSNENILYLDTPQGQMELKLDAVKSLNGCKALVSGKKLTVACARGSDAYMHAIDITASNK